MSLCFICTDVQILQCLASQAANFCNSRFFLRKKDFDGQNVLLQCIFRVIGFFCNAHCEFRRPERCLCHRKNKHSYLCNASNLCIVSAFLQWKCKFYIVRKVCFCSSKKQQCFGYFRPHLGALFNGIVKRCIAKQNGCSGSQGIRDQWTKIVTNCPHPHDVALICDRNHSHASWTTARHEKYFRTGSKQRRIHEAVVFLTGPFHLQGFSWSGKAPLKSTSKAGAAQVGSRRSPIPRRISATGATVQGGHITVHTCDAKVERGTGVRVGARCLTTQDTMGGQGSVEILHSLGRRTNQISCVAGQAPFR